MQRYLILLALLFFGMSGCKEKELSSKFLTNIPVMRNIEESSNTPKQATTTHTEEKTIPAVAPASSEGKYYIIVGSFGRSERSRAQKLVNGLKSKGYPAEIIDAKGRLRVSIESFTNEKEAEIQRDKYREITDRQDIWIMKP